MADTPEPAPNWRFGAFELVGRTGELRRDGAVIHLQEQPGRLLVYLLQHAGQIVTREDLRTHLWPAGTFVDFDHSLNTAVMKLREALRDSSEKPLYIQTIPRKGYRFVAPVAALPPYSAAPSPVTASASEQANALPSSNGTLEIADPGWSGEPHAISAAPARVTPQSTRRRAIQLGILAAALIFLALVGAVVHKRSTDPPASTHSLTRITFDEGLQSDPTWSPDGRYIAYSAVRNGVTNIWMQQISVGDPIQITTGPGPNWQPDWSPDGKYIAYRSDTGDGGLYVIPAVGGAGQERRIASFGYNPRWSPDNSKVLFENGPLAWTEVTRFYIAGLDGGRPREVLSDFFRQHKELNSFSATWHPDGRRITVWVDDPVRSGSAPVFWTMPVDGGPSVYTEIGSEIEQQLHELAAPGGDESLVDSNFAWAPSGDALYFERTFRGARSLWRLNVNPRTLRATSVKQLTAGEGLDTDPAVSPDGKRLAFTAASGRISAWLYPFDPERGKITGAGRAVTSPGIDAWLPSVSQDGSRLVFLGVRAGETRLWLKSLPDGRETPLFVDGFSRNNAQWSRDGTRLAYLRIAHHPEEGQLMTWSSETRQEEPLTSPSSSATDRLQLVYDWSSDDTSLLVTKATPKANTPAVRYEAPGGSIDIAVWRVPVSAAPHAESKEHLTISDPAYDIYQAHQSPDGRWIVFEAVTQKHPQDLTTVELSSLYVMRASGGPWLPIVVGKNWADKPRWSPDGRTIYFLWSQGSFFDVWGIRFDPQTGKTIGDPFRITTLDNPALMIPRHTGSVEMSVTQKDLALTLGQVSGSIWVLNNVDR